MKSLVFGFMLLSGLHAHAAVMSPASRFVNDTLTLGKQILESRDQASRFPQMCNLISTRFYKQAIADVWLADYANIGRDQAAIDRFPSLVPAILIGKVFGDLSGAGGTLNGSFKVGDEAVDRGEGLFEVPVTLTSAAGREYRGSAIVREENGLFLAVDIEYMNMSAVHYQGQQFQDVMKEEYDKDVNASLPVSFLIEQIESDGAYKACP